MNSLFSSTSSLLQLSTARYLIKEKLTVPLFSSTEIDLNSSFIKQVEPVSIDKTQLIHFIEQPSMATVSGFERCRDVSNGLINYFSHRPNYNT